MQFLFLLSILLLGSKLMKQWQLQKRTTDYNPKKLRRLIEQAYKLGFYQNVVPSDEIAIRLKTIYTEWHRAYGISPIFFYAILRPLVKYPNAFQNFVMEPWGSSYYGNVVHAIHYWYCDNKAVRSIADFDPKLSEDDAHAYCNALITFLFNRYQVPEMMLEVWWTWEWFDAEEMSERTGYKAPEASVCFANNVLFHWYFTIAEGGNLRLSPYLPVKLSKQAAFWFSQMPYELSILQSFYWAKAKAKGLSNEIARAVAQSCDVFLGEPNSFDIVCDCLLKAKDLEETQVRDFIDFYVMVRWGDNKTKLAYFGQYLMPSLQLKNRTVASVLRMRTTFLQYVGVQAQEATMPTVNWAHFGQKDSLEVTFLEEKYLIKVVESNESYQVFEVLNESDVRLNYLIRDLSNGWESDLAFRIGLLDILSSRDFPSVKYLEDSFCVKHNGQVFEIVRLGRYKDLVEEAIAMENCVVSYGSECSSGNSSIWSLRDKDATRLTTIELNNYHIVQASARFNQDPDTEILAVLKDWEQNVLAAYAIPAEGAAIVASAN
jgi:hypothetical protein